MMYKNEIQPTAEQVLRILFELPANGNGGVKLSNFLAGLGPERYNALSRLLHQCGMCGGEEQ